MRRFLAAGGVIVAFVCLVALPASAHVVIEGGGTKGGYATFSFQVPNEQSSADTTRLEVQFPIDHPLASVAVEPVPGWTATVEKIKLAAPIKTDDGEVTEAVSKITWSGGEIKPGEFQQFPVAVGPLPGDTANLEFKTVQTYSNGEVARWIEDTPHDGPEPEHPAPVLHLTAADAMSADATANAAATKVADLSAKVATSDEVDSARTVAVIGIVVGAAGLIVALVALFRRPKSAT